MVESFEGVESYFRSIEVLPLAMPALLDYQFHSPDAILVLNADLAPFVALNVVLHQRAHVEEQRHRFRCRRYAGRVKRGRFHDTDSRIVPWADVEVSRGAYQMELSRGAKATLASHTPRCRRCGCPALDLTWVYYVAPACAWLTLAGTAGWMAICESCHEQIALFIDRQN